jgi:hypothetical protein
VTSSGEAVACGAGIAPAAIAIIGKGGRGW